MSASGPSGPLVSSMLYMPFIKYLFSKIKDDLNLYHAEANYMYILI